MNLLFEKEFGPIYAPKSASCLRQPTFFEIADDDKLDIIIDEKKIYKYDGHKIIDTGIAFKNEIIVIDNGGKSLNFSQKIKKVTYSDEIVIETDTGTKVFHYAPQVKPSSIQMLGESLLLTLAARHQVLLINRSGDILWSFGEDHTPGRGLSLCAPHFAMYSERDQEFLITDTLNGRVIKVNREGRITWQYGQECQLGSETNRLWRPMCAKWLSNGNIVIADSANSRIIEVSPNGKIVSQIGEPKISIFKLAFPRSVTELPNKNWLISNTYHNNVLEVNPITNEVERVFDNHLEDGFHWPRCAVFNEHTHELVIGDGRNNRIVFLNYHTGRITGKLQYIIEKGNKYPIGDPHDIQIDKSGHKLLVTLTLSNLVVEIDRHGHVLRKWENMLDPHSANYLKNGIIVANSAKHQIVIFNDDGNLEIIDSFYIDGQRENFTQPRYAFFYDNILLVLDTDAHRIIQLEKKYDKWIGKIVSIRFPKGAPVIEEFFFLRWISATQEGNILISDTGHHRVLSFQVALPEEEVNSG
ncbi:hypothetical protein [Brevibacillus sp. SAFN-007a]|uniref:hypothetical protein n=1 Tax=Brevibacillus sp. SAFN-007a TaxID=3436862 RepID=UPI003F7E2B8B